MYYRFTSEGSVDGLRGSMREVVEEGRKAFGGSPFTRRMLTEWWNGRVAQGISPPIAPRTWETILARAYARRLVERMDRWGRWEAQGMDGWLDPAGIAKRQGPRAELGAEPTAEPPGEPSDDEVARLLGVDPKTGKKVR